MNELMRKDKILIVVFALATLVMSVANPADYDIRSLAWDVGLLIVAGCSVFWFLGELGSMVASGVVGDVGGSMVVPKSRKELVGMVGDVTGIGEKTLNGMSDVELVGLLNGRSKVSRIVPSAGVAGSASLGTVLMAGIRVLFRVSSYVVKSIIRLPKTIRNIPKVMRKGMKNINKIWKEESRL